MTDNSRRSATYEEAYARFELAVPAKFNFARDVFDRWAEDPSKTALWWVDDSGREEQVTFARLAALSRRACNVLTAEGVGRGDVVLVILPRVVEWWVLNLACLRLGAVISTGTTQLSAKDIRYRLEVSDAVSVITDEEVAPRVEEAVSAGGLDVGSLLLAGGERSGWASLDALLDEATDHFDTVDTASDEDAILYFTSGTTGGPKMTLHTHASYPLAHRITGEFWLDLREEDVHWNISDTGWAKAGWSSLYGPWHMGATVFVHHAKRFEAGPTLDLLSRYPITSMCAAPTVFRLFALGDLTAYEFPALRSCVTAGEPLNPETFESWRDATGIPIREGYGQTETVVLAGAFPGVTPRAGSMGKPAPGFDVQVIDEDGRVVAAGSEGDIAVRVSPERPVGLFKEYWKDPERTARCYRGDWYVTGDRAIRDEEGYLYFVGRADDVILSAAYRIGPFEVESALLEHDAVAESAAIGIPDDVRGAVVKAFVVLAPGHEPSERLVRRLQEHVKQVTAPYKYPRVIEFVPDLPKTVSGKIRRKVLRDREWGDG